MERSYFRILMRVSVFTLFLFGCVAVFGAGEVDPTFSASAQYGANGSVYAIVKQADGKLLIGGSFASVNGVAAGGIARLNTDGSVDSSFNSPDLSGTTAIPVIYAIGIQSSGKILIGGDFSFVGGVNCYGIRRLNTDGTLDTSFPAQNINQGAILYDIKVQPDDKILIGGNFSTNFGVIGFARLLVDGGFDGGFSSNIGGIVKEIYILGDGRILVGGAFSGGGQGFLLRVSSSGVTDNTFGSLGFASTVETIKVLGNGQIIFGGAFSTVNGTATGGLARTSSEGVLDTTFNQGNAGANGSVNDIDLRNDGKILISGSFTLYNGSSKPKFAQLNSDGTVDNAFTANLGAITAGNVARYQTGGQIMAGYVSTALGGMSRLNSDGSTDGSVTYYVGKGGAIVHRIYQQADGKVIAGGEFDVADGVLRPGIARYNADGTLDTAFAPTIAAQKVLSAATQSDGKVLIGMLSGLVLKRLNTDGSTDGGFTTAMTGYVNDIVVLGNGQILVGGSMVVSGTGRAILKLNANGSLDGTFNLPAFNGEVKKVLVQPDEKILVGGDFTSIGGTGRGRIARLNADGTLDGNFAPPSGANNTVFDLDLQTDGKIVVVGAFGTLNGSSTRNHIGRLDSLGFLDANFAQSTDGVLNGVKIQPNGKILVAGSMAFLGGGVANRQGLARFNADGSVDTGFLANCNNVAYDVDLQSDGKVLAGGQFTKINGVSKVTVARLANNILPPRTAFDFDGDLRSDIAVFRPSTNRWYLFLSSNSTVSEATFGVAGDIIAPADFDGDGKTDIAIFRPSTGDWWYQSSINNAQISVHWGQSGDMPRPADFDGDGKADFIVFRPSNSVWYRYGSTGATSIVPFGSPGDKPVTGDFDGDGRADPAIFRPSTGDWWWLSSITGQQLATHWGVSTDVPAPGDYDGDGRTDFAVYRPSTGTWYINNSSNGSATIVNFGIAEDKPVAADYDGDGKADIAVFRPSTGIWYLLRSSAGFTAINLGISTDTPVENAFVP